MVDYIKIELNEAIQALEDWAESKSAAVAAAQKDIYRVLNDHNVKGYNYNTLKNGDTAALNIGIDSQVKWMRERAKTPITVDGREQDLDFADLDKKIVEHNKNIADMAIESQRNAEDLDKGVTIRGRTIKYKFWQRSADKGCQNWINYNTQKSATVTAERDTLQKARDELSERVETEATAYRATATADLATLKQNVRIVHEIGEAPKQAVQMAEALRQEADSINNVFMPVHPRDMNSEQISAAHSYSNWSSIIHHSLYETNKERFEKQVEIDLRRTFNGLMPEDISAILERNVHPLQCKLEYPFRATYWSGQTSLDTATMELPERETIRFKLIDPSLLDKKGEPQEVFYGNLFWHPKEYMLGIESVKTYDSKLQNAGIGRVETRNIFDLGRALGAERIDLLAGESAGPYFWAKVGAKLQPEGVEVRLGMLGRESDYYRGADNGVPLHWIESAERYQLISAKEAEDLRTLAKQDSPDQFLWHIAEDTKVRTNKYDEKTTLKDFFLTADNGFGTPRFKYAARFELMPENADPRQTERINTYLSQNLVLDETRYAAARQALVTAKPQYYHLKEIADRPSTVTESAKKEFAHS